LTGDFARQPMRIVDTVQLRPDSVLGDGVEVTGLGIDRTSPSLPGSKSCAPASNRGLFDVGAVGESRRGAT